MAKTTSTASTTPDTATEEPKTTETLDNTETDTPPAPAPAGEGERAGVEHDKVMILPVRADKATLMATIMAGILAGRGSLQDYLDDPHYREAMLAKAEAAADGILARCDY